MKSRDLRHWFIRFLFLTLLNLIWYAINLFYLSFVVFVFLSLSFCCFCFFHYLLIYIQESAMKLINKLVSAPEDTASRVRIRDEFVQLGVSPILFLLFYFCFIFLCSFISFMDSF